MGFLPLIEVKYLLHYIDELAPPLPDYVLSHELTASSRFLLAYNVKSYSTNLFDNILWKCKIFSLGLVSHVAHVA